MSECVGEQKDERRRDEGRRDERRMLDAFRLATVHLDDRLREKQQRTVQKNQRYLCTSLSLSLDSFPHSLAHLLPLLFINFTFSQRFILDGKCVNGISDHVYADVYKYKKELDLDDKKIQMIKEVSESPKLKDSKLIEKAKASAMNIGPHLAYRYFVSGDWQPTFHGVKIDDAIVETVNWRHDFGVASIKTDQFTELIEKGVAYTSYTVDKFGRVILYFKLGRNVKLSNNDIYLKLLIYTIERADRMSVEVGSGNYILLLK